MVPAKSTHKHLNSKDWIKAENDSKIAVIRVGDCCHFMMFTYNAATLRKYYVYSLKLYFNNNDKSIQTLEIEEITNTNIKTLDQWMKIYNQTIQDAHAAAQAHGQQRGDRACSAQV